MFMTWRVIGVGAVACAVCCAGPILGFVAAIGLGTAAGFALFGSTALVIGVAAVVVLIRRRRRRAGSCLNTASPVDVKIPIVRTPR